MTEPFNPLHSNDYKLDQVVARELYFRLRDKLVGLRSASEPDLAAIDNVIHELEQAQLAYKASHGIYGNNPLTDVTETQAQSGERG
jgi:hypothetical protein